ncbi:substrate-binding domain-containing protein [Robinsoniella sp. KNHs210]|uniref:substrate-binding domain-containing protein n=1 Tax=Robinsoniella sp. KNHs210 TaxID=1469950 RepID=UPI0005C7E153|nr:substrate-binding domain-containing protein [Robinsoniella sp. KNHs210]
MKVKKLLAVMMALGMTLSLAACGSGAAETTATQKESVKETEAKTETKTETKTESKADGTEANDAETAAKETDQSAAKEAKKDPKDIKVAGVVFQEDQFMMLMQMGYQAAADHYGVTCMLSNTNNDQAKEAELINTYVTQGIDGIAISPLNETSSIQTLKMANEKGLEIAVGNTQLKDAPFVCGGFTSDNYNLGELTGKEARKYIEEKLGGKAKIAIVEYKSLLPEQSTARRTGFVDQLEGLDVEIVADQDAWLQDTAIQVVGDILTANESKGGIDMIWAANDGGTIGATMAVKNAGKAGTTVVFGTDAAEQQAAFIQSDDNILQCVTGQDPYTIGYNTMEVLIKAIMGEEASYGKEVVVPGIVLTRDDIPAVQAFEKDLAEKTGK